MVMWIVAPILCEIYVSPSTLTSAIDVCSVDYSNTFYSSYMPILSSVVFDNTGKPYDVTKVLTADFLFDRAAYEKYSPVYLPITYVLSYAVQFASLSALVTHTICWHGKDILQQTRQMSGKHDDDKVNYEPIPQSVASSGKSKAPKDQSQAKPHEESVHRGGTLGGDVHSRLMKRYEDAPATWYLMTFIIMLAIGMFLVE